MARQFLLVMACGCIIASAMTAAINVFVDPLDIYGSPRIEGFNALKPAIRSRERIFKTVHAARDASACLIVGTSRAETGLDPKHEYFRGTPCFNAAFGGQPYHESLRLVQAAAAGGRLRRVVALLDFAVANAHYELPAGLMEANYSWWRKASLALSTGMLAQAARTVSLQDLAWARAEQAHWFPDGRFDFPHPIRGHRASALASETLYLQAAYFRGSDHEYALVTSSSNPLDDVRDLIQLAQQSRFELVMVIAPSHARDCETIFAAGLWEQWETWKRRLVAINDEEARLARHRPFALWDFSGYNAITTEPFPRLDDRSTRMKWYFDSSHFTPAAGNLLLDRLNGSSAPFGVLLDAYTLEPHLASIRSQRIAWRARFPVDASEIEAMAAKSDRLRPTRTRAQ